MLVLIISIAIITYGLWYLLEYWYRRPFIQDFREKNVFITGTDSGFGNALALHLDRMGVKVYAGCYTAEGEKDLQKKASTRMKTLRIDVSKTDSIQKAKEIVEKDLPPGRGLWGLVNNAGIHRGLLLGLISIEDFHEVMEVNFFGMINVNNIFGTLVKEAHGRIVNVGSILGRCRGAAEPYFASKAAIIPYNDGLRRWMKTFDVHVALIEPGYFQTEITKQSFIVSDLQRTWDKLPEKLKEEYGEEFMHTAKNDFIYGFKNFPLSNYNKLEHVTNAMTHALLAKRPKSRYMIGYDFFCFLIPTSFPDWLFDYLCELAFLNCYALLRKKILKQRLRMEKQ